MKSIVLIISTLFLSHLYGQQIENKYSFNVDIQGVGEPIILIPGLACTGEVWKETVDSLSTEYECHTITLPGFGSIRPISDKNLFLSEIKYELNRYIKNELKNKPIIIGHSLGGFLGMSLASDYPNNIKKLIIVDSYPFYSAAMNPTETEENSKILASSMKKMIINLPDSLYSNQQKFTLPTMINNQDKIDLAFEWSIKSDRETVANAMYTIMTTDLRDDIAKIKIPILVLGSWIAGKDFGLTKDIVKRNYQNQFKNANNCKIEIAEKAKHFIMWDEPKWFLKSIRNFLK